MARGATILESNREFVTLEITIPFLERIPVGSVATTPRSRRRVLVCDKGNPRNAAAHESHSFFTRDGINPHELLNIGRDQLKPYKSVEFQAIGVKDIKPSGNQFEVVFEDGTMKQSRKTLLAFGVMDEFPDIENFGAFWGKSVFHCPCCAWCF